MRFVTSRFESVSSTNDVAIRMAEDGAPEGTVVVALEQTAGCGRLGRKWQSPAGEGLYLSVILRPPLPFEDLWQIAFVASLAACEAISEVSRLDAHIKWPNDVLLNGRKVCGILVEARGARGRGGEGARGRNGCVTLNPRSASGDASHDPQSEMPRPAVVGIGVNVNNRSFTPEIAETATSILLEIGNETPLASVESALLSRLEARYSQFMRDGFAPILEAWKALDATAGREVSVLTPDGNVTGLALNVDESGDLLVRREDGSVVSVRAGEVLLGGGIV